MSTRSSIIPSQKLTNLQVRGYNLDKRIPLPPLFTREFIPGDRSHIPTSETALKWPHLEQLADKIPPPLDCEVGLLIGYNCQQALLPREIVPGEENHPFAQRTDLGWSIVGCSNPAKDYGDAIGISHRIIVRQVTPATQPPTKLKGEVHFVCRTQVREINPTDILKILESDFTDHTMDDNLISQDDLLFLSKTRAVCRTGNLHLHKFVSNDKDVTAAIPPQELAQTKDLDMALGELSVERALGVQWCVEADEFQFRVTVKDNPLTRRGVLSTVASVFDPLGLAAPFILLGKQILQTLCRDKVGWDEALPAHILPKWESWLRDLPHLAALKIPRSYLPLSFGEITQYELHNFSDASLSGYGTCSYLRAISKTGQISCSLVIGKARVTPTKVMTILRLELSSAVTAVRNADVIKRELEIENLQEYYWTDSKGTNFIGARREFSELLKGMDQERQRAISCEFVMNVPCLRLFASVVDRRRVPVIVFAFTAIGLPRGSVSAVRPPEVPVFVFAVGRRRFLFCLRPPPGHRAARGSCLRLRLASIAATGEGSPGRQGKCRLDPTPPAARGSSPTLHRHHRKFAFAAVAGRLRVFADTAGRPEERQRVFATPPAARGSSSSDGAGRQRFPCHHSHHQSPKGVSPSPEGYSRRRRPPVSTSLLPLSVTRGSSPPLATTVSMSSLPSPAASQSIVFHRLWVIEPSSGPPLPTRARLFV
ncbi:hypothetical protein L3Q82_003487 [Scortum barcoo]|uniref:Uncharacterized protein n=1 Tax=Scortum barcoo TaxID=214431 RepID=A0ACB8VMT7_9TELE|nr:hypothetical protein L3Q82_003487 [Scortum barcoo]